MKSILFENSKNFKKNKHIYFGDWCLDDPKKLDKNSFSKFKKKLSMNIIGIVIEN